MEISINKLQIPNNIQTPIINSKTCFGYLNLDFGTYLLFVF